MARRPSHKVTISNRSRRWASEFSRPAAV